MLHKIHAVTAYKGQKSKYDSNDSKNEVAESAEQISGDKEGEARPRGKQSKAEAEAMCKTERSSNRSNMSSTVSAA